MKWENEKKYIFCVKVDEGVYFLSETLVVLLFFYSWVALLSTFTLGSCLQVMSNWEKRQKNYFMRIFLKFWIHILWFEAHMNNLGSELKGSHFSCLHSQPSLFLYQQRRWYLQESGETSLMRLLFIRRKSTGEIGHSLGWFMGQWQCTGGAGAAAEEHPELHHRELPTLWEQRTFSFLDSKVWSK